MKLYSSLLTGKRTVLHFDNGGSYGHNFKEAQVTYNGFHFYVIITDGYKYKVGQDGFSSLKAAVAWGKNQIIVTMN